MKRSLLFYLLLLSPVLLPLASAQQRLTANEAADSAQSIRSAARKLFNKTNPNKQELEQSIKLLNNAIQFVDRDSIKNLGEGSLYLKFRKSDLTRDLIYAYALNHQYDEVLATFDTHFKEGTSGFMLPMENDSTFLGIRSDPRFIAAINKYKARLALWKGTALKTGYKTQLSDAEKIAGLSLFWSQARANFVYFDKLPADWNQTYLDFIPQVQATKTTLEYYRVLQKFCAQLHDGHSNVFLPKELSMEVNARPPVRTDIIEGRVFITEVRNDSLRKDGLLPGLEIVKIDNIPVKTYADTYIKPYQGAATPQDMEQRTFNYYLLAGAASKPVLLELRDKQGHTLIKSISRSGYAKLKPVPAMEFKVIDHIGYLNINNFEDEKIIKQFDSLYTRIAATKGLIIDVRNNSGGSSYIGQEILSRLTDKHFDLFAYKYVRYDSKGGEPFWANQPIAKAYPNKTIYYTRPVVMLVSAVTYSAAEDFVIAFDYMKRGKLIGQTTGGSTGQPIGFSLPGGGTARICGKSETYPDGKEFVDTGIKPDIMVDKTVDDLYKGKDSVLRKALEVLN